MRFLCSKWFQLRLQPRGSPRPTIARPVQSPRGPGNHYCEALSQPHSVCAEIETPREETWGGLSPHNPTRGLGSVVRSPFGVRGTEPGRKWISCIFEVRKKPPGTHFSVFLSDVGPSKRLGARETPLSTGLPLAGGEGARCPLKHHLDPPEICALTHSVLATGLSGTAFVNQVLNRRGALCKENW